MSIYHWDGASDEKPNTGQTRRIIQSTEANLVKPVPHILGHGNGNSHKEGVVSAKCKKGFHNERCTMLNCTCECHQR